MTLEAGLEDGVEVGGVGGGGAGLGVHVGQDQDLLFLLPSADNSAVSHLVTDIQGHLLHLPGLHPLSSLQCLQCEVGILLQLPLLEVFIPSVLLLDVLLQSSLTLVAFITQLAVELWITMDLPQVDVSIPGSFIFFATDMALILALKVTSLVLFHIINSFKSFVTYVA